ncbi:chromosomal replication initiator protein DnaA [Desulfotomaculum copahuensis]|uniref:Chromosomal replication initiator protein DnaA n=1 Tax=Desulfotomaculum copahuensis TaxID=1838280 RepID=A0A1B7LBN3_9FIRM|nr:chromosomal replication initiator protein DnaA [Desulfotomaculum copahuensis]OAT79894.1 chromosomal replication initiation protein DnaA [Desulfotomaculum copahuensis]
MPRNDAIREVNQIWKNVLSKIKPVLDDKSYETWISSLHPLGFHRNTLFIEVTNYFHREWLSNKYAALLKETIYEITCENIEINFISSEEINDSLLSRIRHTLPVREKEPETAILNPKYTFDTFVVGNSNRFAHAASLAVAESPAQTYNPLFIYGGVGLGKTHLMHAISHHILTNNSQTTVAYVTSEKFTNDMINAIRDKKQEHFRNKYRNMDILLIDDIQFLQGKEGTQEEFFHTFNTLYEASKQIIISSDRPPKEIPTLEDRLRSRFEWGLITDIQPPDLETRIAILRKKAIYDKINIPDETLAYIAQRIQSNIRELEGALIRLAAYASLYKIPVTNELAANILKDMFPKDPPRKITPPDIQKKVAEYYGIHPEEIQSKRRTRNVAFPRQIAMYLTREITDLSLPQIGEAFGGKDHTTVLHACDKIKTEMENDPIIKQTINELIKNIKEA